MKKFLSVLIFILITLSCQPTEAPTEAVVIAELEMAKKKLGEPTSPHTSAEWKIWAYSTAAPSFIASECTVLDVDGAILREGTNGWTAMAANPRGMADPENGWKDAHEAMAMVGDAQAMKWAMAYMSGKTPEMDHDGWAWMLHGDMGEDNSVGMRIAPNDDGGIVVKTKETATEGQWIESGPHLMLMPKDPSTLKGMSTDFNSGAPYVMFAGTGYDHVMIPVEGYYEYQK